MADSFTRTMPDGTVTRFDRERKVWVDEAGNPLNTQVARRPADEPPQAVTQQQFGIQPGAPVGFIPSLKANLVDDFKTKAAILSDALGIPAERFGALDGQVVYTDDDGIIRSAENNAARDVLGDLASGVPEIAGGIGGSMAGTAAGIGPVAGGALGAAAGSAIKNLFANTVLEEPQSALGVASEIGTEAALDAVAGAVGAKAGRLITRRAGRSAVPDIGDFDRGETLATIKRIEDVTGIKLDVAQASGLASLRRLRVWAFKYPNQASNILQANKALQEGKSFEAVDRIMGSLTEALDNTLLASDAVNAAKASIDLAKNQRALATAPMYRAAFDGAERVDITPLIDNIDSQIDVAVGPKRRDLIRVRRFLSKDEKRKGAPLNDLEQLHEAKLAIDEMLGRDPKTSAANVARRAVTRAKRNLVQILEDANPVYKTAQEKFALLSEQLVRPLEDGMIGELARVKGSKTAAVVATWFMAGTAEPSQIRAVRKIIEAQHNGRDVWRGLLKTRIATALDTAAKETQGGELAIGPKFRAALFASPKQRAAWAVALDGDSNLAGLFDTVMEAFTLIARAGTSGSDTAFNLAVESGIRDAAPFAGVRNFTSNPLRGFFDAIVEDSTEEFVQKNAVQIAEAMVDPARVAKLKQLRTGGLKLREAATVMGMVIGLTTSEELLEAVTTPAPSLQ